jgi:phosphatidylglycerol lysyltransferase
VRYRIYGAAGVPASKIARLMMIITVSFGAFLTLFAAASALGAAPTVARLLHTSDHAVRLVCIPFLATATLLLALCNPAKPPLRLWRLQIERPTRRFVIEQFALVAIDVAAAAATLWLLLPAGRIGFVSFTAVFAVATLLGVISHVPGGLGVFEAAIVFALGHTSPPSATVAALLAYRAVYFFLPLLASAALLAGFEVRTGLASPGFQRVRRSADQIAPLFLGVITFASGAMLLFSGATPAFTQRLALLSTAVPLWVVEASNALASLLGVVLLFVARGLFGRLDGAWWLAMVTASVSLVLSLTKGLAFGEAAILACLIALLAATRKRFNRPAWLLRENFTVEWFVAIGIVMAVAVWVMFFAFRDVPYARDLWWEFEFDAKAPRALRATLGGAVLAALIALWQLLRPAPGRTQQPAAAELAEAERIIRRQDRSDGLLAMMGDKSLLFSQSRRSFLMYSKRGRSWVALYDPVGPAEEWPELVLRFVETAARHGGRAAFYQVRLQSLPVYLDAGLKIMKLGEEARIDLDAFKLAGSRYSHLRYAIKRGERDGLSFELIPPEQVPTVLPALRQISDGWLQSRGGREKGFSVAAFTPRYLAAQSVALVRQAGQPVAFVTVMATDLQAEATIGVMRRLPDASPYAMEYLLTQLALALKTAGYNCLSLGMTPLAGLSQLPLTSHWHRLGGLIWRHGNRLYDFQGLQRFKNKFDPVWEPRYLAASGTVAPFVALADIAVLTGGRKAAKLCAA